MEAEITVNKYITNISLGGSSILPIPGSTILYKIECQNTGSIATSNIVIYDEIQGINVTFLTNSSSYPSGWTNEFSTNTNPDQSYNSADYTTSQPPVNQIKWIRWKKSIIVFISKII